MKFMQQTAFGICLVFLLSKPLFAGELNPCLSPALPSEFDVQERLIRWTNTFDVQMGNTQFGTVSEQILNLTRSFNYYVERENPATWGRKRMVIAKAGARVVSWGSTVDIVDCENRKIGTIQEQVMKSLFKAFTVYTVMDGEGRVIAISEKVDWIGTKFTLKTPEGRLVATISRPWLNFLTDVWHVKIHAPSTIDPRVLVMIAAYKTSVDNERRKKHSQEERE